MINGPCGKNFMENVKWTKEFPKKFNARTNVCESGYILYARPDNGIHYLKKNKWKKYHCKKKIFSQLYFV